MGEVYLARFMGAAGFEKRCVIKKILPERAQDPTFVQKFLNEGRTLVALTHSNIVQVFDMGDVEGEYYLAMEHISGADLRFLLRYLGAHKVQLSESVCCYIMMETLKGLSYAHRAVNARGNSLGIIHRDVSPSNILVSAEGEVKLIDFGIAKSEVLGGETFSGVVQGKFNYMSPEQARGGLLDQRTDIFSAGVVLYEMLTGCRPFEGKSDLQTLELVKSSEHPPLCGHRPEIHPALEAITARALQKQPEERFQSADEFYAALEGYLRASAHVVNARDLVAAFESAFEDASTKHAGTSQDVFDEALRSLLNAQARYDDIHATRSMRLTDSFSERLPKACPADFASALLDDVSSHEAASGIVPPNDSPISLHASPPAQAAPQRRLSPLRYALRYALIALCIILLTLGASKVLSEADATIQHAPSPQIQPQSHTVPLPLPQFGEAAAAYQKGSAEMLVRARSAREPSIDLEFHTTPSQARIDIIEGAYRHHKDNEVTLLGLTNAELSVSAPQHEPCFFRMAFDDEMPNLSWRQCGTVSTQFDVERSRLVLGVTLFESPDLVSSKSDTTPRERRARTAQTPHAANAAPSESSPVSAGANVAATLTIEGRTTSLPTELLAKKGASVTILPTSHGQTIAVPFQTTVHGAGHIEARFCQLAVRISEFFVPGDPAPYQIADIAVDGITYARDTDAATFILPCGKRDIRAIFRREGQTLEARQSLQLEEHTPGKLALTLRAVD